MIFARGESPLKVGYHDEKVHASSSAHVGAERAESSSSSTSKRLSCCEMQSSFSAGKCLSDGIVGV